MKNIIAVDWGGSKLETGLVAPNGEILYSSHYLLPPGYNYGTKELVEAIKGEVQKLREACGEKADADVMGLSCPGVVNVDEGIMISNGAGIYNWNGREALEPELGLRVVLDKDVNACAIAEKRFGVCKDTTDFMWITISSGCGAGMFLANRCYRGFNWQAGEVGYIQVEYQNISPVVEDGLPGDMEDEGSGNAIGRKYLRLKGLPPDVNFKSKQVGELARQGDELAQRLFYETGVYLARLTAFACGIVNLQKVVVGGGTGVYDFELMKQGLWDTLPNITRDITREGFSLELTSLGYQASMLGAAAVAMEETAR